MVLEGADYCLVAVSRGVKVADGRVAMAKGSVFWSWSRRERENVPFRCGGRGGGGFFFCSLISQQIHCLQRGLRVDCLVVHPD